MSILDITDTEAECWLSGQLRSTDTELEDGLPRGDSDARAGSARPGRLHLLLGDSIARDSGLKAADAADEVLHRALGGATWASTLRRLPEDLAAWRSAAATFGMDLGQAIVWLSGNDVYSRLTGLSNKDRSHLENVMSLAQRVVRELQKNTPDVTILGPLPRFGGESAPAPGKQRPPITLSGHC